MLLPSMLKKVYLAEYSETYRHLLKALLKPFTHGIVDLWSEPAAQLEESPECLIVADEAFLAKGPGPARSALTSLFMEGRISQSPLLILERREKQIPFRINSRAYKLRRPFLTQDLENILGQLGHSPRFPESEAKMTEQSLPPVEENISEKIEQAISQALQDANLSQKTQEALEKAIREIVPSMAEKMIKEEIERLTR